MNKKIKIYITVGLMTMITLPWIASSQQKVEECPLLIRESVLDLKADFYQQLNQNLTTAQPSSDTLTIVFNLYRQFLQDLKQNYTSSVAAFVEQGNILGDSEALTCTKFINDQKQQIAETLVLTLKSSSSLKQTYNLVEKYSHINTKFHDFQSDLGKVNRDLKTFSQKLPCYSSSCVQN